MTPPPAANHSAQPLSLALNPVADGRAGTAARLLAPRAWSRLRLVIDVLMLCLASCAALLALAPVRIGTENRWLAGAFPFLVLAILQARRSPEERLNGSLLDTGVNVLGAVSLAAMLTIAAGSIIGGTHQIELAVRLWLFGAVYLGIARVVLLSVRRRAACSGALATPTLIVGADAVGGHLVKRLLEEPRYGLRPVGFLDSDPLPGPKPGKEPLVPFLGSPDGLCEAIRRTGARHVIVAFSSEPDHVLVEQVKRCQGLGVEVSLVPRMFESMNEHATIGHIGGTPLVSLHATDPLGWGFAVKHAIDRAIALLALLVLAPVMAAVAIAVCLTSPGAVLFRQRRVGRDGHEFDVLKFRTMRVSDDEQTFELLDGCAPGGIEGKDRRTKVGRYLRDLSLDELPQFINVLRGEMSLIGPRPERPEFAGLFAREVTGYEDRHRVRPGITGWAQVHGLRGQTSIADRVEWDNYYIQNWSLQLDLRIVALTLAEVLRCRDSACASSCGPLSSTEHPVKQQLFRHQPPVFERSAALELDRRAALLGSFEPSEAAVGSQLAMLASEPVAAAGVRLQLAYTRSETRD